MTNANTVLKQTAIHIAKVLESRDLPLHQEIKNAEDKIEHLKLLLEASGARQRSLDFSPTIGNNLQCPECWVRSGDSSLLTPIPTDPNEDDKFYCAACFNYFSLPS